MSDIRAIFFLIYLLIPYLTCGTYSFIHSFLFLFLSANTLYMQSKLSSEIVKVIKLKMTTSNLYTWPLNLTSTPDFYTWPLVSVNLENVHTLGTIQSIYYFLYVTESMYLKSDNHWRSLTLCFLILECRIFIQFM